MCGFAGIITKSTFHKMEEALFSMSDSIAHRGPDDSGLYINKSATLGMAHRRLSIQDLSSLGHQPMQSKSRRFVVVFNGEIYNFKDLRKTLSSSGHSFNGGSDTEVILAGFEHWGVKQTLQRCIGMFALAVLDNKTNELLLARDRFGEKPLYYSIQKETLLFASELNALAAFPAFDKTIDPESLSLLFRHNFIPAPFSIFENTHKLLPGHIVTIPIANIPYHVIDMKSEQYWSLETANLINEEMTIEHAVAQTDQLLRKSIERQMISDAPLGAFLSGGVDSSTVVAIMQQISSAPVRTFSIGFNEPGFNEARHAKEVANYLGTKHTELYVSGEDALSVVPKLSNIYGEPFADSSQLPTFLLCQMAKRDVTVSLSGDGGDELFCGYERYFQYNDRWNNRNKFKRKMANLFFNCPNQLQVKLSRILHKESRKLNDILLKDKLLKRKSTESDNFQDFYRNAVSINNLSSLVSSETRESCYALTHTIPKDFTKSNVMKMMYMDLQWYLPDDILVKVDRAAMANSLETRVPMLDHEFAEFALSIPTHLNIKDGVGKQVLREVLYQYVPKHLIERPKAGFAIPVDTWLRKELKGWVGDLLSTTSLKKSGLLDDKMVVSMLDAHWRGDANYGASLWGVLMFQQWLDEL